MTLAQPGDVLAVAGAGHRQVDQRQVRRLAGGREEFVETAGAAELHVLAQLRQLGLHRRDDQRVIVGNQDLHRCPCLSEAAAPGLPYVTRQTHSIGHSA